MSVNMDLYYVSGTKLYNHVSNEYSTPESVLDM